MSMSGIEVDPSIPSLWNDVKLRGCNKYAGFKLSDDQKKVIIDDEIMGEEVTTESVEEDEEYFKKMKSLLTKENPRYLIYDFGFKNKEGRHIKKLSFIFWCSEKSPIGKKMIYASTKDTIKKAFSGLSLEFQANDFQDLDYTSLMSEVEKKA